MYTIQANKVFFAFALIGALSGVSLASAVDELPKLGDCTAIPLVATSLCSSDYSKIRTWRIKNPNVLDSKFTWVIKDSIPVPPGVGPVENFNVGYNLPIAAGQELQFSTDAAAGNTIQIWENGNLDSELLSVARCDCQGVAGGVATIDLCGICGGNNKTIDACGICGGDGTTCQVPEQCVIETATADELAGASRIKRTAMVLVTRSADFSKRATKCDRKSYVSYPKSAKAIYASMIAVLQSNVTNSVKVCTGTVCSSVSQREVVKKLNSLTKKLYVVALNSKLQAIRSCKQKSKPEPRTRKDTSDYRDDVLLAIKKVPNTKIACTH